MDQLNHRLLFLVKVTNNSSGTPLFGGSYFFAHQARRDLSCCEVISASTCSKLWVIAFFLGLFTGLVLKKRVRQWTDELLKQLY